MKVVLDFRKNIINNGFPHGNYGISNFCLVGRREGLYASKSNDAPVLNEASRHKDVRGAEV